MAADVLSTAAMSCSSALALASATAGSSLGGASGSSVLCISMKGLSVPTRGADPKSWPSWSIAAFTRSSMALISMDVAPPKDHPYMPMRSRSSRPAKRPEPFRTSSWSTTKTASATHAVK